MLTDDELFEALREEASEIAPEVPGGLTEEAALIAQQVDPAEMNELELHVVNRPPHNSKPEGECELGSCLEKATHYTEFLSGTHFFGCEEHVNTLIKMKVAKKKRKFE